MTGLLMPTGKNSAMRQEDKGAAAEPESSAADGA
jgi:hypothetical protein